MSRRRPFFAKNVAGASRQWCFVTTPLRPTPGIAAVLPLPNPGLSGVAASGDMQMALVNR